MDSAQLSRVYGRSCMGSRVSARAHGDPLVPGCGPNAVRKRLRKALIGQTGACGLGLRPSLQPQLEIRFNTAGSWAMIEIGTSWLRSPPLCTEHACWEPRTNNT